MISASCSRKKRSGHTDLLPGSGRAQREAACGRACRPGFRPRPWRKMSESAGGASREYIPAALLRDARPVSGRGRLSGPRPVSAAADDPVRDPAVAGAYLISIALIVASPFRDASSNRDASFDVVGTSDPLPGSALLPTAKMSNIPSTVSPKLRCRSAECPPRSTRLSGELQSNRPLSCRCRSSPARSARLPPVNPSSATTPCRSRCDTRRRRLTRIAVIATGAEQGVEPEPGAGVGAGVGKRRGSRA